MKPSETDSTQNQILFYSQLFCNRNPTNTLIFFVAVIFCLIISFISGSPYAIPLSIFFLAIAILAFIMDRKKIGSNRLVVSTIAQQNATLDTVVIATTGDKSTQGFHIDGDPYLVIAKNTVEKVRVIPPKNLSKKQEFTLNEIFYSPLKGGFEILVREIEKVGFANTEILKNQKFVFSVEENDKLFAVLKEQGFPIEK